MIKKEFEYEIPFLRERESNESRKKLVYFFGMILGTFLILSTFQIVSNHQINKREQTANYVTSQNLKKEIVTGGKRKIRGVTLGGWLVASIKITGGSPLWTNANIADAYKGEYTAIKGMEKKLNRSEIQKGFHTHWNEFINEEDFKQIAKYGFNTVRIPVGYWIAGGEIPSPYVSGAIEYLDKAMEWAEKHGLLILINMQAAPGSQNGDEHSSPEVFGEQKWTTDSNIERTKQTIRALAKRYRNKTAFLGIGLLNEPLFDHSDREKLIKYYNEATQIVGEEAGEDTLITTSPFRDEQGAAHEWQEFGQDKRGFLFQEWHRYQEYENRLDTAEKNIIFARTELKNDILDWERNANGEAVNRLLIGEWSLVAQNSMELSRAQLIEFAKAQLDAYRGAKGGWIFYTWKFYNDDNIVNNPRSMKSLLRGEIFTRDLIIQGVKG